MAKATPVGQGTEPKTEAPKTAPEAEVKDTPAAAPSKGKVTDLGDGTVREDY